MRVVAVLHGITVGMADKGTVLLTKQGLVKLCNRDVAEVVSQIATEAVLERLMLYVASCIVMSKCYCRKKGMC